MFRSVGVMGCLAACLICRAASAQLFATTDTGVAEYDQNTGAVINSSFISGLSGASEIAVDTNGHLFVNSGNTIEEFSSSTGVVINANLASVTDELLSIAVDNTGHLYTGVLNGEIGKYDISTATGGPFISTAHPYGLAADVNGNLYAACYTLRSVKFNAVTGQAVDYDFAEIPGNGDPLGVAADREGHVFISYYYNKHPFIEYDSSGHLIDGSITFSPALTNPLTSSIAVTTNGDAYVAYDGGIGRLDPATDTVVPFINGVNAYGLAILPEPSVAAATLVLALLARPRHVYQTAH